ncbi:unnamed protein product, partial [Caretta caretta]
GWRPGYVPPAHSHRQGCENLESRLCHFGQHLQVTWWRSGSCRELTQIWFCTTDGPLPVPTPSSSCSGRSWWIGNCSSPFPGACTQETTTAPSWCLHLGAAVLLSPPALRCQQLHLHGVCLPAGAHRASMAS